MDSQLRQIAQLVQARRYDEARPKLQAYLRDHPEAAYGWYLQSFTAESRAAKQAAIRKAVELAPESAQFARREAKLGGKSRRSPALPIVLVGVIVVGLFAGAFLLLRGNTASVDGRLPTVAALNNETPDTTAQTAAVNAPTATLTAADEAQPTATPTAPTAATRTPPSAPTATASATEPPTLAAAAAVNPSVEANAPPLIGAPTLGTLPPTIFLPAVPSSTPTNTPQPSAPTATPVSGGSAGAPPGTPVDIGTGTLRVVAATRPGSSLITELGGSAANPPAGQEWVVVEALLICSGSDNCAPDVATVRVVGASGGSYAPAPDFNMPQLFGPEAYALGQVWGYLGFRVPTSETGLRLSLTQNGQTYLFALS